jgi:DNA uptake protein ComE-like DNA-binding protein
LFYFDPNTLPEAGFKELGLRDRTIQTIQHYREKGGRFRRPEDLGKIYGLYPDEYARLLPYVKIEQPLPATRSAGKEYSAPSTGSYTKSASYPSYPHKTTTPHGIEINAADTLSLITLPGIGERLAGRIVHFRDKLGGFYSVDQVGETYALPDSVFQQIKILLRCDSNALRHLDINTADANTLRQHPYISWNIANAIVEYRRQHGDYKNVGELQKIDIITSEFFQKLRPYLTVGSEK